MLSLSPVKLLVVLVVALILLGPDKLPQVARQLGAGWRAMRDFHARVDQEVRQAMPDLPPPSEIARLARSPVALLNQLADLPGPAAGAGGPSPPGSGGPSPPGAGDDGDQPHQATGPAAGASTALGAGGAGGAASTHLAAGWGASPPPAATHERAGSLGEGPGSTLRNGPWAPTAGTAPAADPGMN